jgi:acetyl esterase
VAIVAAASMAECLAAQRSSEPLLWRSVDHRSSPPQDWKPIVAIDEQTAAFLDASNSKSSAPPGELPLLEFRAAVEGFRAVGFDRESVTDVRDVLIEDSDAETKPTCARLFLPAGGAQRPLVIWAHGGSWVRVSVDLMDSYFRVIANRSQCAVLAVDYRLSPESRFPEAIGELYRAARWAQENAALLGIDPRRIGIGGESSGGNLAAATAVLARDRKEFQFAHQTLVVPLLDARFSSPSWEALGQDYLLTKPQLEWALTQYAPGVPRTNPLLSPLLAVSHSGLPPALIISGEYDPLRDDAKRFASALVGAGVPVDMRECPGLIHHAVMVPKIIPLGAQMIQDMARAMGDALRSARLPTSGVGA